MSSSVTGASAELLAGDSVETWPAQMPEHLIRLPGGPWGLWRWAALRGAGFPAAEVLKLSSPECAAAADRLLQLQDEAERARERALEIVNRSLDLIRGNGDWDDKQKRNPLLSALRSLKAGKVVAPTATDAELDAAIEAFRAASAQLEPALQTFQNAYQSDAEQTARRVREIASNERFQEAIIWQNRGVYQRALRPLLHRASEDHTHGSKNRQDEELIANYLQRYCVKNDTIGFFGPVGWARLVDEGEGLSVRPGPTLLARRNVYFEGWCFDALAEKMTGNKELLVWAAPRRVPFVDVKGTRLYLPSQRPKEITALQAAILQACDGNRTAKEIAAAMLAAFPGIVKSEAFIYKILEALRGMGLVRWTFEIPLGLFPERVLRGHIERIGDEQMRALCLEPVANLEEAREAVRRAGGEPEKLDRSIGELEDTFTRLTGLEPTRAAGQTYAARTLVYEDCRRDIEIEIGPEILESLGPPLSLLLASARWFSFRLASLYREAFQEIYTELVRRSESATVDAVTFWMRAKPLLFGEHEMPVDALQPALQQLWSQVLAVDESERRVQYSSDELRPRVLEAFAVPDSGFGRVVYHSPDIMLAAASTEAIRRGEYQLVMGELHLGTNTLGTSTFVAQHPSPADLHQFVDADLPAPRFLPIVPKQWPQLTSRTLPIFFSAKDYRLALAPDSCYVPKEQALPMGSLILDRSDGELIVRSRDGRLQFGLFELCTEMLVSLGVAAFKMLPPRRHMPRITFDRLVVSRESWSFEPSEMGFAFEKDKMARLIAARRWARTHDLPRFVFVKVPVEVKPFYLDFDSPLYVNMFAKAIRRTAESAQPEQRIGMSEMLPRTDEIWLPDADGNRYTCEFRIVARNLYE
ncbi:MAG TPA: lantibiotic dehydratase [Pyrinomonadaceae bacterium]|jgi:tetratricopeptide (TPR) repeat protein|nr:lantibiotic dehydratase [Pyrinomonadaceae bacterium]